MIRKLRWPLVVLFLLIVGTWPAAATPVVLVGVGAATLLTAIPGPALLLLAAIAVWRTHRPAPARTA
ncbi:hypothetical protein [Streptomyces rishiriensis]|uniref:hypothetical protein n=1 Tax=Streptomyces rishiriensis TaxID=68264 RepID=UPI000D58FFA6|nr:hypothetical protein [Streptomyces rishiriensis]